MAFRFGWGKHSGKTIAEVQDVDPQYIQWLVAQPWFGKHRDAPAINEAVGREADADHEHAVEEFLRTHERAVQRMNEPRDPMRTYIVCQSCGAVYMSDDPPPRPNGKPRCTCGGWVDIEPRADELVTG